VSNPVYLLVYADQDISDEHFWVEGDPVSSRSAAVEAFRLRSKNWTCKLFVEIADHLNPDQIAEVTP